MEEEYSHAVKLSDMMTARLNSALDKAFDPTSAAMHLNIACGLRYAAAMLGFNIDIIALPTKSTKYAIKPHRIISNIDALLEDEHVLKKMQELGIVKDDSEVVSIRPKTEDDAKNIAEFERVFGIKQGYD